MSKEVKYNKMFAEDSTYLIKKFRQGDENAMSYLIDFYGKSLIGFCNSIVKNISVAEDIVQEVFIKIWESRNDFNDLLPLRVYMYRVARNSSMDYLKHLKIREKHQKAIIDEVTEDFIDQKMIEEELLGEIYRMINLLPAECSKIFQMGLNGMSNQEIADELSLSINTVKSQKQKALKILKERFGACIVLFL